MSAFAHYINILSQGGFICVTMFPDDNRISWSTGDFEYNSEPMSVLVFEEMLEQQALEIFQVTIVKDITYRYYRLSPQGWEAL